MENSDQYTEGTNTQRATSLRPPHLRTVNGGTLGYEKTKPHLGNNTSQLPSLKMTPKASV